MYMKNQMCSAKRKKVQTLDSCFRLLALISRVQHNLPLYMYMYVHIVLTQVGIVLYEILIHVCMSF